MCIRDRCSIAQIFLARENVEEAAPLIREAYEIVDRTGRLEGVSVIGVLFGQFLIAAGQREQGLAVLRRSVDGFRKLGREERAGQVAGLIEQIEKDSG